MKRTLHINTQFITHREHSRLILYKEILAHYSGSHTAHTNAECGKHAETSELTVSNIIIIIIISN